MNTYQHLRENLGLEERKENISASDLDDISHRAQSVEQDAGLLRQVGGGPNEKKARNLTVRVLKGMTFIVRMLAGEQAAKQLEWVADRVRKS